MKRESHPLLRGGRRYSRDPLSSAEMESLTSMCEAVFPPLKLEHLDTAKHNSETKALQYFWKASASQFSIPQEVPLNHIVHVSLLIYLLLCCIFT